MTKSHGWIDKTELDWLKSCYFAPCGEWIDDWLVFLHHLTHRQWPEDFEQDGMFKWTVKQATRALDFRRTYHATITHVRFDTTDPIG